MSASLVGSEMCIRDSCVRRVLHTRVVEPLGATEPTTSPAPGSPEHRARTCLLYTSDAADDM
eukprot:10209108-Alexandrium_andersonii.AAC.1